MLSETKIAVAMPEADLELLVEVGEVIYPTEGTELFAEGQRGDYLYVMLDGDIHLTSTDPEEKLVWLGPGDFFGEIGFILATPRTKTATAASDRCILWRLHRSVLWSYDACDQVMMLGRLLVALSPYIQIRLLKLTVPDEPAPDLIENHCDVQHPSIQQLAADLRRGNDWDTTIAVWEYVREIPYRFCSWHVKASETLRLGYGNCTTKANLQAALLRANGIEAGIHEMVVTPKILLPLMPAGYRHRVKPTVKHYYGVAKLDGRWTACEACFPLKTINIIGDAVPEVQHLARDYTDMRRGEGYTPTNLAMGLDLYDLNVLPDLSDVMRKRSFYDPDQAAGMNVVLDQVQGYLSPMPIWAESTLRLIEEKPKEGFRKAYANITADLHYLHSVIQHPEVVI